jgi:hypothetical protein
VKFSASVVVNQPNTSNACDCGSASESTARTLLIRLESTNDSHFARHAIRIIVVSNRNTHISSDNCAAKAGCHSRKMVARLCKKTVANPNPPIKNACPFFFCCSFAFFLDRLVAKLCVEQDRGQRLRKDAATTM